MEKLDSALCQWIVLYINYFNFQFSYLHNFANQITLKSGLPQKFSTIMGQINAPFWTHVGHKGWSKDGKTFIGCYTIALKFWDELNANFALLYFSSYSSIKKLQPYLKNLEKNNKAVHLRLVLTYLFTRMDQKCTNDTRF